MSDVFGKDEPFRQGPFAGDDIRNAPKRPEELAGSFDRYRFTPSEEQEETFPAPGNLIAALDDFKRKMAAHKAQTGQIMADRQTLGAMAGIDQRSANVRAADGPSRLSGHVGDSGQDEDGEFNALWERSGIDEEIGRLAAKVRRDTIEACVRAVLETGVKRGWAVEHGMADALVRAMEALKP